MSNNSPPSPWTIVNDYSKTVVTIAAGFLAFTVTFSEKLYQPRYGDQVPYFLLLCWVFLVLAIAAALYAVGRLTSYLRDSSKGTGIFLLSSNVAYFLLLLAAASFFIYAYNSIMLKDINTEAFHAEKSARNYLTHFDSKFSSTAIIEKATWNEVCGHWEFIFKSEKDSIIVEVDPKQMKVTKFKR